MKQERGEILTPLLQLAIAPTIIFFTYLYVRDKYEKEPIRLLALGLLFGAYSTVVILALNRRVVSAFAPDSFWKELLFTAFISSSGIEESVKFIFLFLLVWKNKNFNERFDGIVYSVFISLGFAGVENIVYVFHPQLGGYATAFSRAIFSVPGHGLFGIAMGYYVALVKFEPESKWKHLCAAFFVPWLFHGIYNAILLLHLQYYLVLLIPFVCYLWITGLKKMKLHLEKSPFQP